MYMDTINFQLTSFFEVKISIVLNIIFLVDFVHEHVYNTKYFYKLYAVGNTIYFYKLHAVFVVSRRDHTDYKSLCQFGNTRHRLVTRQDTPVPLLHTCVIG